MRTFSFRDLRLIPELKQYNELYLIRPCMDRIMFGYLGQLGFDLNYPIQYIPAKHRDMQNKVGIGFRAVGQISTNRKFINSKLCSVEERLIAASYTDLSLARHLAQLLGSSTALNSVVDIQEDDPDFPPELIEPDYESVAAQILRLEKIRDEVRGNPYNAYGSLKTPAELLEELDGR